MALAATALVVAAAAAVIPAAAAGAAAPPLVTANTNQVEFGPVEPGTASTPETVELINRGPGTATGLVIGVPAGAFARSGGTCGGSLAAGASCTIAVTYTPTGLDPQAGKLNVAVDGGSSTTVYLRGRPDISSFPLRVTATDVDLGSSTIGQLAAPQGPVITNTTDAPLSFTYQQPSPGAPWGTTSSTCVGSPVVLEAGASCGLGYVGRPASITPVTVTAVLDVAVVDGPARTFPVTLRMAGETPSSEPLRVTPRRIDFGSIPVGVASAPQTVVVTNTSARSLSLSRWGAGLKDGVPVAGTGTCPTTLAAGAFCTLTFRATPAAQGAFTVTHSLEAAVFGRPRSAFPLTFTGFGVGETGVLSASRAAVDLGPGAVGVPTAPQQITVRNTGSVAFPSVAVSTNTGNTSTSGGTCSGPLAAGSTCTVELRYTATRAGRDHGSFTISAGGQKAIGIIRQGPTRSVHEAFLAQVSLEFLEELPGVVPPPAEVEALDTGTTTRAETVGKVAASPQRTSRLVRQLYVATLGRRGDPKGEAFWTAQIVDGRRTVAQVAAEFYASNEYYAGFGHGSDEAWLRDLYVKLLKRSADPSGLTYWTRQVERRGRLQVAATLYDSPESRRTRVTNLYVALLQRGPDPGGLAYWSGQVLTKGDIALAARLAASDEYLRRTQDLQLGYE